MYGPFPFPSIEVRSFAGPCRWVSGCDAFFYALYLLGKEIYYPLFPLPLLEDVIGLGVSAWVFLLWFFPAPPPPLRARTSPFPRVFSLIAFWSSPYSLPPLLFYQHTPFFSPGVLFPFFSFLFCPHFSSSSLFFPHLWVSDPLPSQPQKWIIDLYMSPYGLCASYPPAQEASPPPVFFRPRTAFFSPELQPLPSTAAVFPLIEVPACL